MTISARVVVPHLYYSRDRHTGSACTIISIMDRDTLTQIHHGP